jgi:glutathione synthase/RimK-type ligase-like ATP-grasp enzyme
LIIFITAQPDHPTKQQIIHTLDNSHIPFEVVHPTISWWMLRKKLRNTPNPLCLITPDHPRIFNLCKSLTNTNYRIVNSPYITLLCKNRISISLRIQHLLSQYKQTNPTAPIHIPDPRYYQNPNRLGNALKLSDFPIVIKYPVNHTGIHYVNMIQAHEIDTIPRFFKKCGVYIEKFIEAQDNLLKCYNFGDIVITQQESNRQSLYRARTATSETYKSRKHRKTIKTPSEIEAITRYIAKELGIMIFGMDFLITKDENYWLVDFNDFPGARGIENAGEIIANILIREKNKAI